MAHDQPTQKCQQDLVEVLTTRSEALLTAYNQAAAHVGELMRAQLTRDPTVGRLHRTAETVAPPRRGRPARSGAATDRSAVSGTAGPH